MDKWGFSPKIQEWFNSVCVHYAYVIYNLYNI